MKSIRPGAGENGFVCRVTDVIENPFSYTVMLTSVLSRDGASVGWELSREEWETMQADELRVHIPRRSILLLRDE